MEKIIPYIIIVMLLAVLTACHSKPLPPLGYVHYIENPQNGLLKQRKYKGMRFSLQYEPVNYVVMTEMRSLTIPNDTFKVLYNKFKGLEHYIFRIYKKGVDSIINTMGDTSNIKSRMTKYFDFGMRQHIKLIENDDTIPCGIIQFDGGMGAFPYYSFVIGFPTNKYHGDRTFLYEDKLFKTGDVKIELSGSDIRDIPALKRKKIRK